MTDRYSVVYSTEARNQTPEEATVAGKTPFNRKKPRLGPGSFGTDGHSGKGGGPEQNHTSSIKRFNIKDPEERTATQ